MCKSVFTCIHRWIPTTSVHMNTINKLLLLSTAVFQWSRIWKNKMNPQKKSKEKQLCTVTKQNAFSAEILHCE